MPGPAHLLLNKLLMKGFFNFILIKAAGVSYRQEKRTNPDASHRTRIADF